MWYNDYDVTAGMRRKSMWKRIGLVTIGVVYVLALLIMMCCSMYTSYDMFVNHGAYIRGLVSLICAGIFLYEAVRFLLDTDAKVTKNYHRKD